MTLLVEKCYPWLSLVLRTAYKEVLGNKIYIQVPLEYQAVSNTFFHVAVTQDPTDFPTTAAASLAEVAANARQGLGVGRCGGME